MHYTQLVSIIPHLSHYTTSTLNRRTKRRFNEFVLAFGLELGGTDVCHYLPNIVRLIEYKNDTLLVERYLYELPTGKFMQYKVRYHGIDAPHGFVDRHGLIRYHQTYQHLPLEETTMGGVVRDILRERLPLLKEDEPYIQEILDESRGSCLNFMDHITLPVKDESSFFHTLKHLVKPIHIVDNTSQKYHRKEIDLAELVPFAIPERFLGFQDPCNLDQYLQHMRYDNHTQMIDIDDHELYNLIEEIPVTHFHVHIDSLIYPRVQYGYNQYAHLAPINPINSDRAINLFKWIYVYITEYIRKHYPEYPEFDSVSIIRSSDHVVLVMRSTSTVVALGYMDLAVMALCGFTTFLSLEG